MSTRGLRRISLVSGRYFWRAGNRHHPGGPGVAHACAETFSAFLEQKRRSPLRVIFPEGQNHGPGYPSQMGIVVDYREPTWSVNLNRPAAARLLIELALLNGWSPATARGELVIANGYDFIRRQRECLADLDPAGTGNTS